MSTQKTEPQQSLLPPADIEEREMLTVRSESETLHRLTQVPES